MWTIPNAISFARLLGVPAILYFGLISQNDFVCFCLFVFGGVSDWLDGYLARKLNQFSDLGTKLDPIADRLYIVVAITVLLVRGLIPGVAVILIVAREIMLAVQLLKLRMHGFDFPAVHYVGKAGTLMLLYSVPFIFLGNVPEFIIFKWFGIAWLWWGIGTYWAAGLIYRNQIMKILA